MANEKIKILTLIIQKRFFDLIIKGEKKQEFRELRPTTYRKYCVCDDTGAIFDDTTGKFVPKKFDAIQFFVGYNKDRETAVVEIKNAEIVLFTDNDGNFITYDHNGDTHYAAQIVYDLGKIIRVGRSD